MSVLCGTVGPLDVQELDWTCSTLAAKVVTLETPSALLAKVSLFNCTSHFFPQAYSTGCVAKHVAAQAGSVGPCPPKVTSHFGGKAQFGTYCPQ